MAAVLRLSGGLDRSHNQIVESLRVQCSDDQVELLVSAEQYPEVDLWAARRRAVLFERVFDTELTISWNGQPAATESNR